jgi:DNA-binding winged helix-turn-helix (wHTH) protein
VSRVRYRFGEFCVSPARRLLLRSGHEVALIPRYLDLLILLLERRHEAVHRREIFETVWSDVVVSDGALSQAVRTLRRALGDDSREPVFIRTVSRHGYRFAFDGVVEEAEDDLLPAPALPPSVPPPPSGDPFERELQKLLQGSERSAIHSPRGREADPLDERRRIHFAAAEDASGGSGGRAASAPQLNDEEERREAAEALHSLGTAEALRRLDRRPGHEAARALLRDARWDVPGAGPVPLIGAQGGLTAAGILISMRLRRALRVAERRWAAASGGGAAAGAVAGALGGLALRLAPGSHAPASVAVTLALVGAIVGGLGAAGVGAGLAAAEAVARSWRGPALVLAGGAGGGLVGALSNLVGRWLLEGLFGRELSAVGGGLEGLGIGAAAGLGYALATPRREGGMATARGGERLRTAAITALSCAAAAVAITALGGHLAGTSLNFLARSFQGSQVGLAPLARMLGEPELGRLTRAVIGAGEGAFFGFGLALGLTRRPG